MCEPTTQEWVRFEAAIKTREYRFAFWITSPPARQAAMLKALKIGTAQEMLAHLAKK